MFHKAWWTKKRIIIVSIIGVVVLVLSTLLTWFLVLHLNVADYDYSHYDVHKYEKDYSGSYRRYLSYTGNDYSKDFTSDELVNIGYIKLHNHSQYYAISEGYMKTTLTNQDIRSIIIRDGDNYFEEDLSYSFFAKPANRFYQDNEKAAWYQGSVNSKLESNYEDATEKIYQPVSEFENEWGRTVKDTCAYVISDLTINSDSVTKTNDGYLIHLDMHPVTSVLKHYKQMVLNGGLESNPLFHSVVLDFTLDKELNLVSLVADEVVDVHKIVEAKDCHGVLTTRYFTGARHIPSLLENADYSR